ncbi:DNA alkylation repair protein [Macrococcoides caseolyticum]|uniref:DNA alkylation repair protein n=1 Tax=Macrococcoides caseolyticum TaxID=69966 RepID=UPI001F19427B|nr:DNA alkylation repair protein [Macrococcus caseolyticus]MCE4957287.1 DNA alkylation repair protein [Macrococcus caseolyticus]
MLTIQDIIYAYEPLKNDTQREAMESYMKHNFPFLGISKRETAPIMKMLFKKGLPETKVDTIQLVNDCFNQKEREYHYIGMTILNHNRSYFDVTDLDYIETLLKHNSWWDSIDTIAPNIVGTIVLEDRGNGEIIMRKWNQSDDFWIQRASLLHQLKYKTKMNEELLTDFILNTKDDKEFFIRKAIGWVLREYSKTNPDFVTQFVATHELSGLSSREALKWLNRK